MRDLNIPVIEEPERFFPDPVLVRRAETRRLDDGYGELYHGRRKAWVRVHPVCLDIIDGVHEGLGFDAIVDRIPDYPDENIKTRKSKARLTRKFLWTLHQLGHIRIELEPAPAVFHDRYRHVQELGRGGLGIAHLCADTKADDRLVVVKHPWGVKTKIKHGQEALAVEIALLSTLEHPSLPRLLDQFTVRGLLHMVRDYVEGRKLSSAYHEAAPVSREWRLDKARQVAEALHYIHQSGYLFFDPSPDNFFLTAEGRVMLTDVGGCRAHDDGIVVLKGPRGTPGYVAPELRTQTKGRRMIASVQSDVWSFGCLYYHLTLGHRPRRTWREAEIHASLLDEHAPQADAEIIRACVRDDPDARPADMGDVLSRLG